MGPESKSSVPMVLIATAVLALTAFLLWPPEDPPVRDPEAGRAQAEQIAPPEQDPVRRESLETEGAQDPADGPAGRNDLAHAGRATLIGRVVDEAGRPRAGASVLVALARPWPLTRESALIEMRTRSDGSFRLEGIEPGESYRVHAAQDGFAPAVSEPVEPGVGETLELGDLTLASVCRVAGKVVDATGNPISGASVKRLRPRSKLSSVTDVDGRFSMDDLPPGKVTLLAQAPGFESGLAWTPFSNTGKLSLELRPGERRDDLLIVLKNTGIIRGRIVGPDGAPIVEESFLISARTSQDQVTGAASETVSENGAFVLSGLDPDRAYDLLALGLSGRRLTHPNVRCEVQDLVFEFQPLPVVQVSVRAEANRALLLADQVILRRGTEEVSRYSSWTWHDSQKDVPPLLLKLPYREAGTYELSVARRGFLTFQSGAIVLDGQASFGPITALLREDSRAETPAVSGIVRRAGSREPLPGVRVALTEFLGGGRGLGNLHGVLVTGLSNPVIEQTTHTDQDGLFAFARGISPRSLVLKDTHYHSSRFDLPRGSAQQGLELLAYESGAVEGHVTLMNGRSGVAVPIVAHRPDAAPRTTKTNGDGGYRLAPLLPGRWYISVGNPHAHANERYGRGVRKPTHSTAHNVTVEVTIPEGHITTADIDLREIGAALEGTVTVNGLPRISLSVTLIPLGRQPKDSTDRTTTHMSWTGSRGDYGFPGLPPGNYRAEVRSDRGHDVLADTSLSLLRGQTLRHDFKIRLGRLKVTVLEQESGQPIPKAHVTAERLPRPGEEPSGGSRIASRTDADGQALLLGLTADEFFVIIRTTRGVLGRKLTLPPGGKRTLTVHVPPPATLQINLDNTDALGSESVILNLLSQGQKLYTHIILGPVASSSLTLTDIQPAEYAVRASVSGGWSAEGTVEVVFGEQNEVTLRLERETPSDQGQ